MEGIKSFASFRAAAMPDCATLAAGKIGISEMRISDSARLVRKAVGFTADIVFDACKRDGTSRNPFYAVQMCTAEWLARTLLETGRAQAYTALRSGM